MNPFISKYPQNALVLRTFMLQIINQVFMGNTIRPPCIRVKQASQFIAQETRFFEITSKTNQSLDRVGPFGQE